MTGAGRKKAQIDVNIDNSLVVRVSMGGWDKKFSRNIDGTLNEDGMKGKNLGK